MHTSIALYLVLTLQLTPVCFSMFVSFLPRTALLQYYSLQNFNYEKKLGASQVFDYNSSIIHNELNIGRYLQQLSLFALPKSIYSDEGDEEHGSNSDHSILSSKQSDRHAETSSADGDHTTLSAAIDLAQYEPWSPLSATVFRRQGPSSKSSNDGNLSELPNAGMNEILDFSPALAFMHPPQEKKDQKKADQEKADQEKADQEKADQEKEDQEDQEKAHKSPMTRLHALSILATVATTLNGFKEHTERERGTTEREPLASSGPTNHYTQILPGDPNGISSNQHTEEENIPSNAATKSSETDQQLDKPDSRGTERSPLNRESSDELITGINLRNRRFKGRR